MLKRFYIAGNTTREWAPSESPAIISTLPSPTFFRSAFHNSVLSTSAAGMWLEGELVRPELAGLRLSQGGSRHFFAYNATSLFGFGVDTHGQARSPLMGGASMVACGWETSAAIDEEGQVFLWGRTEDLVPAGELDSKGALKALRNVPLRSLALGFSHALILASDGDAFVFGALSRHGQGGWPIRKVASNIVQIAAGSTHSLLLTGDGQVLSFGSCGDGKLGRQNAKDTSEPLPIEIKEKVVEISAGCDHSVVITEDGAAYSWGFGQHGATGTGRLLTEPVPRRVALDEPIGHVWCGTDFTLFESKT